MTTPIRVLIVDDDADIRTVAELSLGLDPTIAVRTAGNRREAIAALTADPRPEAILLDVMMPDIDGPTLAREIRTLAGHAETPILFLTARAQPQDVERYRAMGAGVIIKPFDPLRLARMLRDGIEALGNRPDRA